MVAPFLAVGYGHDCLPCVLIPHCSHFHQQLASAGGQVLLVSLCELHSANKK